MRALLMIATATALDCTKPRPAPPAAACGTDDELYQVLVNPADDADDFSARTIVYRSGAWSREVEGEGTARGCLAPAQVGQITAALDRATWMQFITGDPCPRDAPGATLYFVDGQRAYTTACGARLDEPSADAVAQIAAILDAARGR